jgi:two-component system LytT family sensor kinase
MNKVVTETSSLFIRIIPSRRTRWLALVCFWSAISFLSAIHWRLFSPPGDPWTWWGLVWIKHVVWFTWGFLATPLILWLGHRFRLEWTNWPRHLAVLIICSLVMTSAYVFAYAWFLTVNIQVPALAHFNQMLDFTLFQHSTFYFLAFWGTVGLEQGLWYYRRWHEREMQSSQLRAQLAQAQLQALRSQIQPHFLFNVLNTVSSTILEGDSAKAYDLTAKLGNLLRMTLDRGDHDRIPLHQEIELVECYLELASARFGDRLETSLTVAPETSQLLVPSFVLLPLVENSVKHVVSQVSGKVRLNIRSSILGETLILEVEDLPESTLRPAADSSGTGRGYRLTDERLRWLYSDNYLFQATPGPRGGMLVHIEIPLDCEAREATSL